jgi:hypothetical protein
MPPATTVADPPETVAKTSSPAMRTRDMIIAFTLSSSSSRSEYRRHDFGSEV